MVAVPFWCTSPEKIICHRKDSPRQSEPVPKEANSKRRCEVFATSQIFALSCPNKFAVCTWNRMILEKEPNDHGIGNTRDEPKHSKRGTLMSQRKIFECHRSLVSGRPCPSYPDRNRTSSTAPRCSAAGGGRLNARGSSHRSRSPHSLVEHQGSPSGTFFSKLGRVHGDFPVTEVNEINNERHDAGGTRCAAIHLLELSSMRHH